MYVLYYIISWDLSFEIVRKYKFDDYAHTWNFYEFRYFNKKSFIVGYLKFWDYQIWCILIGGINSAIFMNWWEFWENMW